MNKYDTEVQKIQDQIAELKAKAGQEGIDIPVLSPDKKFPINLYCNDDCFHLHQQTIDPYIQDGFVMELVL